MDKSDFMASDPFVSPYLRRRLRPLAEVLTAGRRREPWAVEIGARVTPGRAGDGRNVVAASPDNARDGQNRAD